MDYDKEWKKKEEFKRFIKWFNSLTFKEQNEVLKEIKEKMT